ncbi:MFS transporter [Streptomyces hirsutus]
MSAALLGAGQAVMQPALATMIVDCSTVETRSRAFAMQFFLQNLGLGVGGLIGGHLVDTTRASSFTVLFSIEAAMFLLLVVADGDGLRVPRAPRIGGRLRLDVGQGQLEAADGQPGHGAADRVLALTVRGFACCGQFEPGLSAYGVEAGRVSSTSTLGSARRAAGTLSRRCRAARGAAARGGAAAARA